MPDFRAVLRATRVKGRGESADGSLAASDRLCGQLLTGKPTAGQAERWLQGELARVFPEADELIQEMRLDERCKDVTDETLNPGDFLELVKEAFPAVDWDKADGEFRAAGERAETDPSQ